MCYRKQARKFVSWLPEARSRSRGIQVKPDDVRDLGDRLGVGGEFGHLGAPGLDSVVAPHPCHRAVAGPQMLGQQMRTPVCDTVFLRRKVTEIRLSRSRSALPTGAVLVGPHLPAVPRTKNGRQGGLEPEFMPAGVPPPAQ